MKNLSCATVLVVGLILTAFTSTATGLRNEFKEFEIALVKDLHLGKNIQAIWTLSYGNSEAPVTVIKRKTIEGIEYVVQTDFFAVSYALTVNGFGAKETRTSWSSVPKKISNAVINQKQLLHQKIITPKSVDDKQALGLIANYLPDLINDGYTHVLN